MCADACRRCGRTRGAWSEYALDRDLLGTGRFALASASGVFEDGTPFSLPGETDHPPPLELPESARNVLVYLALPIRQAGAVEVADSATEGRYAARPFEAYDTHSASPQPAELQVGRLRMRYLLETDERAGYLCIGLARVTEVTADRRIILDERWIPPSLVCSAAAPLAGLIAELSGMLNQRGEALAARMTAPGQAGVAQVADFLLLQSINGWQNVLAHWADAANLHPEIAVYRAGADGRRVRDVPRDAAARTAYPAYRHDDLQRSFAPVVADLRRALSAVLEATAIADPAARGAAWRAGRADHRPLDPARVELRADGAGRRAGRAVAPAVPLAGEDRRGRAYPRAGERGAAGHRGAAAAGGAAATAVLRRRDVFRAGSRQSALAADADLGRLRDPRVGRFPQSAGWNFGRSADERTPSWRSPASRESGRIADERQSVPEPDDCDRTVIRPAPGGRRAGAAATGSAASAACASATLAASRDGRGAHRRSDGAERISFGLNPLIAAAAPLLQLLGRLRNTYSQPDPGDLRERAIQQMRAFEQAARDGGVPMDQLRPAHYALCASLDDVVLNTPWGSSGGWAARSLVSTFHQEVRSGERFFDLLGQLRQNPGDVPAGAGADVPLPQPRLPGPVPAVAARPGELDRMREDLYTHHRAPAAGAPIRRCRRIGRACRRRTGRRAPWCRPGSWAPPALGGRSAGCSSGSPPA